MGAINWHTFSHETDKLKKMFSQNMESKHRPAVPNQLSGFTSHSFTHENGKNAYTIKSKYTGRNIMILSMYECVCTHKWQLKHTRKRECMASVIDNKFTHTIT